MASYKITQCIIPFINHNRQNFVQVVNPTTTKNTKRSFGTKFNHDKSFLVEKFEREKSLFFTKKFSTNVPCKDKNEGENLAAVLHGKGDLRMENKPVPKPKSNQVLIQMEVCGICGTDVHFYKDGKLGSWSVEKPIVIGHEASGTVVKCGECVKSLKEGDKVALEPQVACRKCALCKAGNYNMCPHLYFCAAPPNDGNLCRLFAHDEDFCHKLPCNLDHELGTLLEPLAVGVHGCKKGFVSSGDSVLVIGGGPVGLASLLSARAYGASKIIVLDIDEFKCKKAMELGADCAMNIKDVPEEEIVKNIVQFTGEKPNKTLECCGFEQAIRVGMLATRTCGQLVLLGLGKDNQCLPIMDSVYREIDIIGAIRYANDYPTAIDMIENGKCNPRPMITHHFKLEDSPKAYETAAKNEEKYIKIVIHANPNWKPPENKQKKCSDENKPKKCADEKKQKKCPDEKKPKKCPDENKPKKCPDEKKPKKCPDEKPKKCPDENKPKKCPDEKKPKKCPDEKPKKC